MTDLELEILQKRLAVRFPNSYRLALLEGALQNEFPDEDDIQNFHPDADTILGANEFLREQEGGYYGKGWPSNALKIGGDGGGGAYFILLDSDQTSPEACPVYYIDWEKDSHQFQQLSGLLHANSIAEHLSKARRAMLEMLEFEKQDENARAQGQISLDALVDDALTNKRDLLSKKQIQLLQKVEKILGDKDAKVPKQ